MYATLLYYITPKAQGTFSKHNGRSDGGKVGCFWNFVIVTNSHTILLSLSYYYTALYNELSTLTVVRGSLSIVEICAYCSLFVL